MFSVYQLGRGSDPVMVVGNNWFAVARSIGGNPFCIVGGRREPTFLSEPATIL
jgi:hypothetical protein